MTSVSANNERAVTAAGRRPAGLGPAATAGERSDRGLIWLAAIVIALVLAITGVLTHSLRESALDTAEADISRVTFLLAEDLDRLFQAIDLTLAETAERAAAGKGFDEAMRERLRARTAALPAVQRIAFSDASGRVIGISHDWVFTATSVADRAYFVAHRERADLGMVVSDPVQSRADGLWSLVVSRRIGGADGGFLGTVWATISLEALSRLFATLAPETGARVTLLRNDMVMLARYPYVPGLYGQSMAATPTFAGIFAQGRTAGSGRYPSTLDHRDRVAAARFLERYPFVISVAVPEESILAAWRQLAAAIGTAALAASAGLATLFWVLWRQRRDLRLGAAALAAAETSLRDERERLSSVVDAVSDGFWEWHPGTGMVDWSERCCAQMGMPAAGGVLHFDQVLERIHPEDRESYRRAMRRHFEEGRPFEIEARWRTFDGDLRWMLSRGRLVRDAEGRPARMVGANADITERKLLETCLSDLGPEE